MKKILIVEDEYSIRESLKIYLEDFDYEPITSESAENGLSLMDEMDFDLAIVDIRLPGMNGESFILRAHELDPKLKFIIHTGSVNYMPSSEFIELGIKPDFVFRKPVNDLNRILKEIKNIEGETANE